MNFDLVSHARRHVKQYDLLKKEAHERGDHQLAARLQARSQYWEHRARALETPGAGP